MTIFTQVRRYWQLSGAIGGPTASARIASFLTALSIPARKKLLGRKARTIMIRIRPGSAPRAFLARDAADIAVLIEMFVDREYSLPLGASAPASIVDIGSHVGASVLSFKAAYPDAVIAAYEPDPENFALLQANTAGLEGVTCMNVAVAAQAGRIAFYAHDDSSISGSISRRSLSDKAVEIVAECFDDVVARRRPDLVKFDVEGAEYAVFGGSRSLAMVPRYIGELHLDLIAPRTDRDFYALFGGYDIVVEKISPARSIICLSRRV